MSMTGYRKSPRSYPTCKYEAVSLQRSCIHDEVTVTLHAKHQPITVNSDAY